MKEFSKYWDSQWHDRVKPNGNVVLNGDKFEYLKKALWERLEFIGKEKLEIGCGVGILASHMSTIYPCYKTMWTGIDLSEAAIKKAQSVGLNAEVADIYTYDPGRKFKVFFFMDSLEHLLNHELLGERIKLLADDKYIIFGNVPLYTSFHEGKYERPVDIDQLLKFLHYAGCYGKFWNKIYGIKARPYMLFEASNK